MQNLPLVFLTVAWLRRTVPCKALARQPLPPNMVVAGSKPAAKRPRTAAPADESLGHIGNANLAAARAKLNDLLDQHPQHVWQMLEMMQNGTIAKICDAKVRDQAKTHWHGTQVRMQVIPKYWMEAYMLDVSPDLEKHMDAIKNSSKTAIRELFYATHMVSGSTLIPASAHEKVVFAKMLRLRHEQCGSRLSQAQEWIKLPGFSWTQLPVFTTKVSDGRIQTIKHISGATYDIPETQMVPAGGEWLNLWSDTEAVYKAGVVTLFMKDIFDLSSLDPQECLPKLLADIAANSKLEGAAAPAKPGSPPKRAVANAPAKNNEERAPFNAELLPIRNNRVRNTAIKKVKGFGPSPNKDRVKVNVG